jgi:hypothetical protein
MADLLDVAPSTAVESVKIHDRFITVRGLNGDAIASIIARFPKIAALLDGSSAEFGPQLIAHCGSAIAPVIAAGCGHTGDEKYEQVAGNLLVEDQLKLFKAIVGLTFPNGIGSFVTALTEFLAGTDERAKPVKMRLKQSPSQSQSSSAEDFPPTMQ